MLYLKKMEKLDDKQIGGLKRLLSILDEDTLTKEDFLKSFEKVVEIVEGVKKNNETEFNAIHENLKLMSEKMKTDTSSHSTESKKEMMDYCRAEIEKMMKQHEAKMMEMDDKLLGIKDGKDADEQKIVADVVAQIKIPNMEEEVPKMAMAVRNGLELLQGDERLDKSAIKGLNEWLEEMSNKINISGGKGVFGSIRTRYIDDETPVGSVNGTNTIFTISRTPVPTESLKIYVNGQRMRITEDYTLSVKTITFNTAPPTGSIILVDLRY